MAGKPQSGSQILDAVEGIWKVLGSLLGKESSAPEETASKKPDGAPSNELADIAAQAADYSKSMDEMRADLGAFGKSVGGIIVAVITALGYTRFNDIFPFPLGAPGWLGPITSLAAGLGLGATTFLIFRFFFAKRRITFDLPKESSAPWWRPERRLIIEETQPYAQSEGFKSLSALDDKRQDLLKALHKRYPDGEFPKGDQEWAQAYRLERVVDLAVWDASAAVLERRTRGAFGGPIATFAIMLAVGGIGFTFATADWAKGRRTLPEQRVREAQVCIDRARTVTTVTGESDALIQACLSKAKLDLGTTVATVTVTTTTPSK